MTHDPRVTLPTVPTRNKHRESRILSVQVSPELAHRIQDITYEGRATGRYPWKTQGEVIRGLLVLGFEVFAHRTGESSDTVRFHQLENEAERLSVLRTSAQRLYDQLATELNELLTIGRREAAIQVLQTLVPRILSLESVEWREWLIGQLRHRFPHLLAEQLPAAALTSLRPDEVLPPKKRAKKVQKRKRSKSPSQRPQERST